MVTLNLYRTCIRYHTIGDYFLVWLEDFNGNYVEGDVNLSIDNGLITQIEDDSGYYYNYSSSSVEFYFEPENQNPQQLVVYYSPNNVGLVTLTANETKCQIFSTQEATPTFTYNKPTISGVAVQFKDYNDTNHIKVSVNDKVVDIKGVMTTGAQYTSTNTVSTVGSIPSQYAPSTKITMIEQGSGTNKFLWTLYPNGTLGIGRYGVTGNTSVQKDAWLPVNLTYLLD